MTYLKSNIAESFLANLLTPKSEEQEIVVTIEVKQPKKPQPKPVFHNTFVRIGEDVYSIYYSETTVQIGKSTGNVYGIKGDNPFIIKNGKTVFIKTDIFGNKFLVE